MKNCFTQLVLNQETTPLNLDHTLGCGQVFRWEKKDNCWYGVVNDVVVKLIQDQNKLFYKTFPEDLGTDFILQYLRINDDLPLIIAKIERDEIIKRATQSLYGLRIVQQDFWECLISYICATFSTISRIKHMVQNLSKKFGEEIIFEKNKFYTFPKIETLKKATLSELLSCGLGFRAKYVFSTCKMINNEINFAELNYLSYSAAKNKLSNLVGVGSKVADCVLLFSLGQLDAFPVDVWIKRIIEKYYSSYFSSDFKDACTLTLKKYEHLNHFGRNYFGQFAGYAQEYLYHYYRLHKAEL